MQHRHSALLRKAVSEFERANSAKAWHRDEVVVANKSTTTPTIAKYMSESPQMKGRGVCC